MQSDAIVPYAPVIIKLLQGILYHHDTKHWGLLLEHPAAVRAYFAQIGVEVGIDEHEGFAYLHQPDLTGEEEEQASDLPGGSLPRLARRIPLSYRATLLCVLLREELQRFDMSGAPSSRLIVSKTQIRDLMRPFLPERSDERRLLRQIDPVINQVARLGFLRELSGPDHDLYEVGRVLKAKIAADTLVEIKEKLQRYAESESQSQPE